jgi:precorrin-3B synthase
VQVHQAADGGLARVRIPGGTLTGGQWQALIAAAQELGNGQLELTSRGNLQLRGLGVGDELPLGTRLADAGLLPSLTHERVRNLLASPLTGRDGAGLLDIRPLVAEFDQALRARPALRELSGRFLFALDDGRADVLSCEPDIALTALAPDSLHLLLAGQPIGLRAPVSSAVALMLAAAEAFVAERAEQGSNAWRVAELADGPTRVAARLGAPDPAPAIPTSRLTPASRPPAPGRLGQADGRTALVVGIPLGSLTASQATVLTRPQLILTPWRSIVLPDLTTEQATELSTTCTGLGLIIDASSPLVGVTACTGRPGCASALADVRADALAIHRAGTGAPMAGVHWSGCARRCGRPATTTTDLVATGSGYRLHSGEHTAHLSELPEIGTVLAAAR